MTIKKKKAMYPVWQQSAGYLQKQKDSWTAKEKPIKVY